MNGVFKKPAVLACSPRKMEARSLFLAASALHLPFQMVAADNLSPAKTEELTVYPSRSLGEAFRR